MAGKERENGAELLEKILKAVATPEVKKLAKEMLEADREFDESLERISKTCKIFYSKSRLW